MALEDLVCREYRAGDTADALEVRNPIFGHLNEEDWDRYYPQNTAALAYLDDEPVGAIPLDQRDFLLAPEASVPVAFEHAVGVKEEYRSRGIGTAMIEAAREFLVDRCDLLLVYRGSERSDGYRFYVKSGHRDLSYLTPVKWQPPAGLSSEAVKTDIEVLYEHESEVLRAYNHTYSTYGGHAPRRPGYWRKALGGQIFIAVPREILFYRYPAQGEIVAYGIFGAAKRADYESAMSVLEIASNNGAAGAIQVMRAAGREAYQRDTSVTDDICVDYPYRYQYRQLGFVEQGRGMIIMGQVINPQRLFRRICRYPEALSDLRINVWTPTRDYVLFEGTEAKREITLEAQDIFIERLLTRHLDVLSAFKHDLLTIRNGDMGIAGRLAEALPYSPWCHHQLDWI